MNDLISVDVGHRLKEVAAYLRGNLLIEDRLPVLGLFYEGKEGVSRTVLHHHIQVEIGIIAFVVANDVRMVKYLQTLNLLLNDAQVVFQILFVDGLYRSWPEV